jgi:serine/threonine protein kinase
MISVTIKEKLGKGSFGDVYRCVGPGNVTMALKSTPLDPINGVQDMLEVSIMSTYRHPNLCHCVMAHMDLNHLYIFMEEAYSDLSRVLYDTSSADPLDPYTIMMWCHGIVSGLNVLHCDNIIHADIKSNNILLMRDGTVKLTDFTLSTQAVTKSDTFAHPCCTITHRAPECMIVGEFWGFPADVWSLGCTFYEIAARDLYIPNQGHKVTAIGGIKSPQGRQQFKDITLSSIIDWCRKRGEPGADRHTISNKDFVPVTLNTNFDRAGSMFRDLVMRMTKLDPKDRPTVKEILNHQYFQEIPRGSVVAERVIPVSYSISEQDTRNIEKTIAEHNPSPEVIVKTKQIISRCVGIPNWNGYNNIIGAFWIATKVITGDHPVNTNIQTQQVRESEKRICTHLKFSLHR